MKPDEKLYLKFPAILKEKLISGEIVFPEDTQFEYEEIKTYRAVEREADDDRAVTRDDFRSYFELRKKPKKPRGVQGNLETNPCYYGVSSFLDENIVKQLMKFPNPNKKMAEGYVYMEGGPQQTNITSQHVCWWLYEDADVSGFKLKGDSNNE